MNESPQQAARRLSDKAIKKGYTPEALHVYTDEQGRPLHWRIRLKHPSTGEKHIRPMKLKGGTYTLGELEYPKGKPLYRLHELSSRPDEPVFIVEGEWCVDALAKIGVLATTSGSADSAEKADWQPLAGRNVRIWPDNDEAGNRYAEAVTEKLRALGCKLHVIDVEKLGLPHKGDAVDWLTANPTTDPAELHSLPIILGSEEKEVNEVTCTDSSKKTILDDDVVINALAALPPLEYDRERKEKARELEVRPATLDKMVAAVRREETSQDIGFNDITPWPAPINPAEMLTEISTVVRRFIVCQDETAHTVALWAAMTWLMDVVQVAPLAVITAPEKRCGKSQLLFLLGRLVCRPLTASNISPAALFRSIDAWRPTLLVDEADTFMKENEELRGLLNCGHTRDSAYIVRVVGEDYSPRKFNVWGAKALAGIGHLADTLMDRAVKLELRRKTAHETVERLRYAEPGLFDALASKLARFAADHRESVRVARPDLPEMLNDRAQDNWEPLLAIAEVAGEQWPEWAKAAALKLSGTDSPTESIGTELLADIQDIFDTQCLDRITTADLLTALCDDDEKPWATYNHGKNMSARQLAKRLGGYGVKSKNLKLGYGDVKKGFERSQFDEAFTRYIPTPAAEITRYPLPSNRGRTSEVADINTVAATTVISATLDPLSYTAGSGVADTSGGAGTDFVEVEL